MLIHQEDTSVIIVSPVPRSDFKGPVIPGAEIFSTSSGDMELVIQELQTEQFTLQYNHLRLFQPLCFTQNTKAPGLFSRAIIGKTVKEKFAGNEMVLHPDQFRLLYSTSSRLQMVCDQPGEYILFDVYYPDALVQELLSLFPAIKKIIGSRAKKLLSSDHYLTPAMHDVIRQVSASPFDDATTTFYFELKLREYLFLMLQEISKAPPPRYHYSRIDAEKLLEAKTILLQDLSRKPYSIAELARMVGINEFKLKAGFRQQFGTGVFECLHEKRMQVAKDLLVNTEKPVKEICTLTGYPRITNFITAFRKAFGYTPGSLRRK